MELFKRSRLEVKKEVQDHNTKTYVDYHKLKEPKEFKLNFLSDLISDHKALAVVDTNLYYMSKGVNMDDEVVKLTNLLDDNGIFYRKVITKKEDTSTIMGIPVKFGKSKTVTNYITGMVITKEDMSKIGSIIEKFNVIFYLDLNNTDTDELLNIFYASRGEMEELSDKYPFNIYNDSFFGRLRICSDETKSTFTEEIIKKYQNQ
jgi:hypothetical protein